MLMRPVQRAGAAESKQDAEWNFSITCLSDVRDCVLVVATALGDLTEHLPAETHRFVALSDSTEHDTGRVMAAAWIGISRQLPASVGEGVLVPEDMFSAMAMRHPPPTGRYSRREVMELEAETLAAVFRSMVKDHCRKLACTTEVKGYLPK